MPQKDKLWKPANLSFLLLQLFMTQIEELPQYFSIMPSGQICNTELLKEDILSFLDSIDVPLIQLITKKTLKL